MLGLRNDLHKNKLKHIELHAPVELCGRRVERAEGENDKASANEETSSFCPQAARF